MDRLTTAEREELDGVSTFLFGKPSVWKKMVKKGLEEPALDDEGKPKFLGKTPIKKLVFKTEQEIFFILKDIKEKMEVAQKDAKEREEKKKVEQAVQQLALDASGSA